MHFQSKWILGFFLIWSISLNGQVNIIQSFEVETWYDNHLAVSNDNEIYLASELKYPQSNFERGSYLIKFDSCNNIRWKKIYQKSNVSLNIQDLQIMESGDILMTGVTGQKEVFLIRINPDGEEVFAKTYAYTSHNFNYTLASRNDQIMIFGNNFSVGGSTINYLLVLDEMGEILWSKNYLDSVVAGEALFCSDGGFLCHSGNTLYKVDPSGNLVWAKRYPFIDPYAGQLSNLVEGDFQSYYFTYSDQTAHFLVKIDANGNPDWTSKGVKAQQIPGRLLLAPDGFYWVSVLDNGSGKLLPVFVKFDTSGEIIAQYQLDHPGLLSLNLPNARFLSDDQTIALFATQEGDTFSDIFIRTGLEDGLCHLYEYVDLIPAPVPPTYLPISFNPMPASFSRSSINGLNISDLNFQDQVLCKQLDVTESYRIDTFLQCGESYFFQTPFPGLEHQWADGFEGKNRDIDFPGIYDLQITDCQDGISFQLEIEKEPCTCETQFPNAFSPNKDGLNDSFKVIAECDFLEYELTVVNRWGNIVFRTTDPALGWDGSLEGKYVSEGTYAFFCKYRADNGIGTARQNILKGELLLLR